MTAWIRSLVIGAMTGVAGYVIWPSVFGLVSPPVLLLLSWLAASGPSFNYCPRHPDINAALNTSAMRIALLRPAWTPRRVSFVWMAAMIVIGLTPGLIIGVWPVLFGDGGELTFRRIAWWTYITPFILCASTFVIESLVQQVVATPLTGVFIFVLLVGAPLGVGLSDEIGWEFESRVGVSAMFASSAFIALWLIDMLRLLTPYSLRAERLRVG